MTLAEKGSKAVRTAEKREKDGVQAESQNRELGDGKYRVVFFPKGLSAG
jgi:hypothetical protein